VYLQDFIPKKKKRGEKHKDRKQKEEEKNFKKNVVVLYLV
jgi:hypothetical protein